MKEIEHLEGVGGRFRDNTKMNLKETEREVVSWIDLT